jgi:hypothetical protein
VSWVRWRWYASTHPSGVGRSGSSRWKTRRGDPDHAAVLADLDPKLHRLCRSAFPRASSAKVKNIGAWVRALGTDVVL